MPNNQQYIEEIIKVAVKGDYKPRGVGIGNKSLSENLKENNWSSFESMFNLVPKEEMLLDPAFFSAIGKVKGWGEMVCCFCYLECQMSYIEDSDCCNERISEGWKLNMHTFLDKIIEKDLDHAIEWLYNLIKE